MIFFVLKFKTTHVGLFKLNIYSTFDKKNNVCKTQSKIQLQNHIQHYSAPCILSDIRINDLPLTFILFFILSNFYKIRNKTNIHDILFRFFLNVSVIM